MFLTSALLTLAPSEFPLKIAAPLYLQLPTCSNLLIVFPRVKKTGLSPRVFYSFLSAESFLAVIPTVTVGLLRGSGLGFPSLRTFLCTFPPIFCLTVRISLVKYTTCTYGRTVHYDRYEVDGVGHHCLALV